ncbi:GNAT family N-acetyltransferase [Streptomyces sp. NPDC090022]|uniref:GNAT family N-acetyltransferase n=1 Tax=Streptomyces sp. NPDC090022 TaxID=3365920 RepID=UPI0038047A7A
MTNADDMPLVYRLARPEDGKAIEALDGSFTTHSVFRVTVGEDGFGIREEAVDPPVHKVFPEEEPEDDGDDEAGDDEDPGARTFVALDGDALAGFCAVSYAPWNRRLTIEDIEVAPAHRGRGVGRALMGHAVEFARECGAGHIWLEVTSINAPAIHAYRRMGFAFCGLDTALYEGTPSAGEHALYMSMPCP